MSNGFNNGDKVAFTLRDGTPKYGTYNHHAPNGKAYIKGDDGQSYERNYNKIRKTAEAETSFKTNNSSMQSRQEIEHEFDINERFDFLQQLVRMVLNKTQVSLIVTGEGGLGKTYTVKRELRRRQLNKDADYAYIKGYSTAKGLFRTLFENNGKLIIFDDCDEVLIDPTAKNLLKGALDSYDERTISWISNSFTDDLPQSFEFTGQVIFISNKSQDSIDQALISRSMCIDLTMSTKDKLKRMSYIVNNSSEFMRNVSMNDKLEALEVIEENINDVRELSLRSLEKVIKVKLGQKDNFDYEDVEDMADGSDWKTLARYLLVN